MSTAISAVRGTLLRPLPDVLLAFRNWEGILEEAEDPPGVFRAASFSGLFRLIFILSLSLTSGGWEEEEEEDDDDEGGFCALLACCFFAFFALRSCSSQLGQK